MKKSHKFHSISEMINQGINKAEKGNFDEAEKIFLNIINLDENCLIAYFNLFSINETYFDEKKFNKIKNISNNTNLGDYEKSLANYLISLFERKNKNFKNEIYYLDKAYSYSYKSKLNINEQSDNFFRKTIPNLFNKKKYIVNKEIQKKFKIFNPIFIVGLPRTGSTLIEAILSSNKLRIPSCGESSIINSTIVKMTRKNFDLSNSRLHIDYDSFSNTIYDKYKKLDLLINKKNFFFIDKSLENFFYIDLILDLFPNAKFINCKRNLFHTSISIYQKFLVHLGWSFSYKKILDYIDNYLKVIKFFKNKYPKRIYDLDLEKLIENHEKISKEVFDFCKISWEPDVLKFYKRKDLYSKTASTKQVRKKIYNYEKDKFLSYNDLGNKFSSEFNWLKEYF